VPLREHMGRKQTRMPEESECYRIGELARRCRTSRRTIDYYTRLGLLHPIARTDGNYRLYGADAPARVARIRALQARRLSLREIAASLNGNGSDTVGDAIERFRLVAHELDRLRGEVAEIQETITEARQKDGRSRILGDAARETLARARALVLLLASLMVDASIGVSG